MSMYNRALGVECAHCHVESAMDKSDKPAFAKAQRMSQMLDWIAQHSKIGAACWTCHRGHTVPEAGPQTDTSIWPEELNLTAEQSSAPASKVYKNLKFPNSAASDLKASMLFMSASLGVGCSHCHAPGAWEKDDKPTKEAARSMLAMVRDSRNQFSDIRIGCPTCHHGAAEPESAPPAGR